VEEEKVDESRKLTPNGRAMGWRPQLPDHRDSIYMYAAPPHIVKDMPERVELPQYPIYDQGQTGSCVGNGCSYAILHDGIRQGLLTQDDVPSRLMIYYLARLAEGTVNEDAGAEIRDGIKALARYGTCLERGDTAWPYDEAKFKKRPPAKCFKAGLKFQALTYRTVPQTSAALRACLAEGFPVVFGFTCYSGLDSDETARTGVVPMPTMGERPIGGHCVALVGYDNAKRLFKFRNSWSKKWGDNGYGYFDYEYVTRPDLAADFWTIRVVG
jgi:C1A family cysteine protease